MEEFLTYWGYPGIFLGIIATGLGFPMPEELPVVVGGGLVHEYNAADYRWWLMLLTCICGVIVGDSCLYIIGRFWGRRLVGLGFVRRFLPPERLEKISQNFHEYGVKILLFARMTPGIRAGIFITAGITRLPWAKFLLADGIYAIPGVTILFCLGWWATDTMRGLITQSDKAKPIIILVVLLGVVAYFVYRHLRKPVVEGSPKEMPPVVGPVTAKLDETIETAAAKVAERIRPSHPEIKCGPCEPETKSGPPPAKEENGQAAPDHHPAPQSQGEKSEHKS